MRVVNTRTSNTVLASNKQLAKRSDEASQVIETGNLQDGQQCWVAAVKDVVVEVHPCVAKCGA